MKDPIKVVLKFGVLVFVEWAGEEELDLWATCPSAIAGATLATALSSFWGVRIQMVEAVA